MMLMMPQGWSVGDLDGGGGGGATTITVMTMELV